MRTSWRNLLNKVKISSFLIEFNKEKENFNLFAYIIQAKLFSLDDWSYVGFYQINLYPHISKLYME